MYGMNKRKPVRVLIVLQCRFVHEAADRKMRHEQTEELLPHQFRRLAAQYNLGASQMGLQLVQQLNDILPINNVLPKLPSTTIFIRCGRTACQ